MNEHELGRTWLVKATRSGQMEMLHQKIGHSDASGSGHEREQTQSPLILDIVRGTCGCWVGHLSCIILNSHARVQEMH